jgi:LysR family transcriptional regulator, low CO2-responsive transcriptional regulator
MRIFVETHIRGLSWRQIETLQAIARFGSLVGAAAALNLTPAALTARLKGLETALGLRLFDRTSNGLQLNSAGVVAHETAKAIEIAIRDFSDVMEAVRTGSGGRLTVGAVSTAKYFAPNLIAAFIRGHPKLDLRFLIGNRGEMIEALRNCEVDVALTGRPPADLPVAKTLIGPHPYVMIAPPSHRLAGAKNIRRELLAGEAFLFREPGSGTRSIFEYFIGDTEIRRAPVGMELASNETIKQAVMANLGIALISAHTIAAETAERRLVCLDVEGLPILRQWFVVCRTDRPLSAAARDFRDFAEARGGDFLPHLRSPQPAAAHGATE